MLITEGSPGLSFRAAAAESVSHCRVNSQAKALYAARMSDSPLDVWLREVANVLCELSASEKRLLPELRRLRRELLPGNSGMTVPAPLGEAFPLPVGPPRASSSMVGSRQADEARPAHAPPTPKWTTTSEPAPQPRANSAPTSNENRVRSPATARSYDYFAELDEKLAVLQRRSSGPTR